MLLGGTQFHLSYPGNSVTSYTGTGLIARYFDIVITSLSSCRTMGPLLTLSMFSFST